MESHMLKLMNSELTAVKQLKKAKKKARKLNKKQTHGLKTNQANPSQLGIQSQEGPSHTTEDTKNYLLFATLSNISVSLNLCLTVSNQAKLLSELISLTPEDIFKRNQFCNLLKNALVSFYPRSSLYIYGASINDFGVSGCELDLLFEPSPDYWHSVFKEDCMSLPFIEDVLSGKITRSDLLIFNPCDQLHFILQIIKPLCNNAAYVHSRHPKIKLTDKVHNLRCNISCNTKLVLYSTELLNFYNKFDKRVKPLLLTLKLWANAKDIIALSNLSSYSFSLMVMFFLQNTSPPILPSLEYLRMKAGFSGIEEDWECSFCTDVKKIEASLNDQTVEQLLHDFFAFYICFDFNRYVICPYTGQSTLRNCLQLGSKTRKEFSQAHAMCIQDPFIHTQNVAVHSKIIFVVYLKEAMYVTKQKLILQFGRTLNNNEKNILGIMDVIQRFNPTRIISPNDTVSIPIILPSHIKNHVMNISYRDGIVYTDNETCYLHHICVAVFNVFHHVFFFETDVLYSMDEHIYSSQHEIAGIETMLKNKMINISVENSNQTDENSVEAYVPVNKKGNFDKDLFVGDSMSFYESISKSPDNRIFKLALSLRCAVFNCIWGTRRIEAEKSVREIHPELQRNQFEFQKQVTIFILEKIHKTRTLRTGFLCDCYVDLNNEYSKIIIKLIPLFKNEHFEALSQFLTSYIPKIIKSILRS